MLDPLNGLRTRGAKGDLIAALACHHKLSVGRIASALDLDRITVLNTLSRLRLRGIRVPRLPREPHGTAGFARRREAAPS